MNEVEIYCPNCKEFFDVKVKQGLPLEMDGDNFVIKIEYPCCKDKGKLTVRLDLE